VGPPQPWIVHSTSVSETRRIGAALGRALRGGEVLALYGDLGTGKTALVGGIAAGLRAAPRAVSSPTFVFVQCYEARLTLAHADLYRLESPAELGALGLSDWLDGHTVVAIEWADKAGEDLPEDRLEIHLSHRGRTRREIRLLPQGENASALVARVRRSCQAAPRPHAGAGRHPAPHA
jgi:tRNA threonylcarbamoyladenosine biosynthesis protein TsaE